MGEARNWRCIECGWVEASEERPTLCPTCGDNANFEHGEPNAEEESIVEDEGLD